MDRNRALELIGRFPEAKVLVVGDVMIDHFIWGSVRRISPEAPVPVVDVARDEMLWGGCANVMNNVHTMGGQVFLSGVIGADVTGQALLREFNEKNIPVSGIIIDPERHTTLKTRIVAHNQQVVRFDRESRNNVSQRDIDKILNYISGLIAHLHTIVISDYNKGVVTTELLDGIREMVSRKNVWVCVDPKRGDLSFYRGFDIITPNHREVERALGIEDINGNEEGKEELIRERVIRLIDELGLKALLITRGEEGMSLYESEGVVTHIPAQARAIYDVTGAGDTAIGIFSLCLAAGATFREAAEIANYAAGIVVGKVGTSTVSLTELRRAL
ncbi:MAG: D-glycero-beta-D-manno-heptose-7-phosphate kinase [Deltaproteobacteria bacterium]|jgi:D-beta-D-heptose 7-phosphate kinase/D-beta-D-heptose 1-phosphate adenosyltransferase|nr:D-glycero-beta-D-manno-heptose-7-phosphate kinase [Deltaproteobacteria bacterium]